MFEPPPLLSASPSFWFLSLQGQKHRFCNAKSRAWDGHDRNNLSQVMFRRQHVGSSMEKFIFIACYDGVTINPGSPKTKLCPLVVGNPLHGSSQRPFFVWSWTSRVNLLHSLKNRPSQKGNGSYSKAIHFAAAKMSISGRLML